MMANMRVIDSPLQRRNRQWRTQNPQVSGVVVCIVKFKITPRNLDVLPEPGAKELEFDT
jgi:hypothetical protein